MNNSKCIARQPEDSCTAAERRQTGHATSCSSPPPAVPFSRSNVSTQQQPFQYQQLLPNSSYLSVVQYRALLVLRLCQIHSRSHRVNNKQEAPIAVPSLPSTTPSPFTIIPNVTTWTHISPHVAISIDANCHTQLTLDYPCPFDRHPKHATGPLSPPTLRFP